MESKWRKAKIALGLNLCVYVPRTIDDASPSDDVNSRFSDASRVSRASGNSDSRPSTPNTPIPSSSGLWFSKSGSRSSKKTCAICLGTMKPGHGHALFTAECSHAFHFHCIASNVKHGNQVCPVCRAKWREIPFQGPSADLIHGRARINPVDLPQDDAWMTVLRRLPPPRVDSHRQITSLFHPSEPSVFNDDEPLDPTPELLAKTSPAEDAENSHAKTLEIETYPEFSAVSLSASHENFIALIHLKAPFTSSRQNSSTNHASLPISHQPSRAPVDLVTVLDVSGSMAGTKLALLKRAMGFVIQNLGPSDRLSVIAFSSTARRLFQLRRMSDSGRQQALQAVNSLISSGGTNIAEGLRKGAKVMEERKERNPVCSIILLSDGQDTYTVTGPNGANPRPDYQSLLPSSVLRGVGSQIPVHAFGFGMDHDAASMHSISETSGGTFSFIEAEGVIQDAFAQCIGGLLSVVVQELSVNVKCVHPGVQLSSIKAGSYPSRMSSDGRVGSIQVGDLYADEGRDFLVSINVPTGDAGEKTALLKVGCAYRDPISKEKVNLEGQEVRIQRSENVGECVVSIEVDRQRNRLQAAEAMAEARASAERGDLNGAVAVLESRRRVLSESVSARAGDQLCIALDAELKEMQERMASRRVYEASGRAYVLSGLSSHSWQRATARGDSTESASLVHAYQTPSMVNMLARSQTLPLGGPSPPPPVRPGRVFPPQPQPR
ncbi:E3 ubiquitin-protein ligase WAV3-like [Tasmannia lanceolata]|uniref:E3 ubiquitin-protein ligase WAV3-like n=1 Tax=Tasmannia lanceolata TaxID=3420 RepID=UPI004064653D